MPQAAKRAVIKPAPPNFKKFLLEYVLGDWKSLPFITISPE